MCNTYKTTISHISAGTPSAIQLASPDKQSSAHEYVVMWSEPNDGGLPIKDYSFKYRPVSSNIANAGHINRDVA